MTIQLRDHDLAPFEPRRAGLTTSSNGRSNGHTNGADGPGTIASPIEVYLKQLHARYAELQDGKVATYIPELAKADPRWFGCCLVTADGQIYAVGDTELPFTIQSISKPFVYATALADHGNEAVLAKIGVEPTGDAFNAISLHPDTGQPLNPMINAGAIARRLRLAIRRTLEFRPYSQGETIVRMGDHAGDAFFLLLTGQVSVTLPLGPGKQRRIATLSPGMSFGEMAVIEETTRSATVSADTDVECYVMHMQDFDRLSELYPRIKVDFLENLARSLSRKLRQANTTIRMLAQ